MKILVVGGSGFLGSEIVHKLSKDGYRVRSFSRQPASQEVEQFVGDIGQPNSYRDLLSNWKPEIVIQTAWVTEQLTYRDSALNGEYARNSLSFAEHCFQSGTRHFVALGTSAEYGRPTRSCNASTTPTLPQDSYGAWKLRTSEEIAKIALRYEARSSWARVFQPYGRNQDPNRLIPSAVRHFSEGKKFRSEGLANILDWVTSRDVAAAVTYTLEHSLPKIVDIGTSVGTSVGDVLRRVAELCGVDEDLIEGSVAQNPPQESLKLVVDTQSPLLAHGWQPQDDLVAGLSWTLQR